MLKCNECYHIIKKADGAAFCFAEGFISEDEPPLKKCPYFISRNKPLRPCPDCNEVHRKQSEFCKHCKILEDLKLFENAVSKSKKIGMYSLDDFEKMNEELHNIENKLSKDLIEIIYEIKDNMLSTIQGSINFNTIRDEIIFLQNELVIIEQILDINELIEEEINDIKGILKKEFSEEDEKINGEIDLLRKENVLSEKISKLEEKINEFINENDNLDFQEFINDFKEIAFQIKKIEKFSDFKEKFLL